MLESLRNTLVTVICSELLKLSKLEKSDKIRAVTKFEFTVKSSEQTTVANVSRKAASTVDTTTQTVMNKRRLRFDVRLENAVYAAA